MSRLNNKNGIAFAVIILLSILFFLVSIESNNLQRQISGTNDLLRIFYGINNIIAFIIPILAYCFYMITTKIMLFLFDIEVPEDNKKSLQLILGFSFIPLLVFVFFYFLNIMYLDKGLQITQLHELENLTFMFGLTFQLY